MLDPLTALGLVSNIVQLISFTAKIVTESQAYLKSDKEYLPCCEEIAELVERQQAAYSNIGAIETTVGPLNREEQAVKDIAKRCTTESRDIISALEDLSPGITLPDRNKKRVLGRVIAKVFQAQVKITASTSQYIERRQQILATLQAQLELALITLIWKHQSLQFIEIRAMIETHSGAVVEAKEDILRITERYHRHNDTERTMLSVENMEYIWNQEAKSMAFEARESGSAQVVNDFIVGSATPEDGSRSTHEAPKPLHWREAKRKLLSSLQFSDMWQRRSTIKDAHSQTFEWLFTGTSNRFQEWLRCGTGMFWVNGKAGSGKPTLMKFISGHWRTRALLEACMKDVSFDIVDFYFWYAGSSLQKSEEGLLRSMLYQIFENCSEVIPVIIPNRWQALLRNQEDSWYLSELRQAVEDIASSENFVLAANGSQPDGAHGRTETRFCFFIDGLDEYQADHLRLVQLIYGLSTKPKFKICVSSRPWNVFEQAFGTLEHQFLLEDLTRTDISRYVHDELQVHGLPRHEVTNLAKEVAVKAQGVFLWVYLTVRSLKEGITEGDDLSFLLERVAALHSDLEDYFSLILSRVHPVYRKSRTMTALYMAMSAIEPSEVLGDRNRDIRLTPSFINFWLLRQGIDDPNFAIHQGIIYVGDISCNDMGKRTRTFLSAICKDLLYLPTASQYSADSNVEFLHRTVYEFLSSAEMKPKVLAGTIPHVAKPCFNVRMEYARFKLVKSRELSDCEFNDHEFESLRQCVSCHAGLQGQLVKSLLDDIDRMKLSVRLALSCIAPGPTAEVFSHMYSLLKLQDTPGATKMLATSKGADQEWCFEEILRAALGLSSFSASGLEDVSEAFLAHILSFDVDVNSSTKSDISAPWTDFLQTCVSAHNEGRICENQAWRSIQILIQHGADLIARLQSGISVEDALRQLAP